MQPSFLLLLLFSLLVSGVSGGRVLVGTIPQGRSHIMTMLPLANKLAAQGHEMHVYFDIYNPELPLGDGVVERMIHVKSIDLSPHKDPAFANSVWNSNPGILGLVFSFVNGARSCDAVLANQPDDFWSFTNETWDGFLLDMSFCPCCNILVQAIGKPLFLLHPTSVDPYTSTSRALGWNIALDPWMASTDTSPSYIGGFLHRVSTTLTTVGFIGTVKLMMTAFGWYIQRYVNDFTLDTFSVLQGSVYHFSDAPQRLQPSKPSSNEFAFYGSYCKPFNAKGLPEHLLRFIDDDSSNGTVLIAFGTLVDWTIVPERVLNAVVGALSMLTDFRVVFAYNGPKLDLPSHILTMDWVPQADLLFDHRTKLFVTHGGLKSLREAICSETPLVLLPLFGDQPKNALDAKSLGFGQVLNKLNLTADYTAQQIRTVLTNYKSYADAAKRAKFLLLDRIMPSLDEAAFLMDRTLRKGPPAPKLIYKAGERLHTIIYFNVDLILAFIAFLHLVHIVS